jgi:hypothetical protein
MAEVASVCEEGLPHPDWAALRGLPYDDLTAMREWLRRAFEHDSPPGDIAGLWFGLFHPATGPDGGASTDIRVGGSRRFSEAGLDWAERLEYRPTLAWACSGILDRIHCIAYGGNRLYGGEPGKLRNAAVWSLCLAYGAFATQRLLGEVGLALALRAGHPVGAAVGFDSGDYVLLGRVTSEGWSPSRPTS